MSLSTGFSPKPLEMIFSRRRSSRYLMTFPDVDRLPAPASVAAITARPLRHGAFQPRFERLGEHAKT